eukprot:COSAG02_NODE_4870_length_4880_cov_2.006902_2_plen_47_part_00
MRWIDMDVTSEAATTGACFEDSGAECPFCGAVFSRTKQASGISPSY